MPGNPAERQRSAAPPPPEARPGRFSLVVRAVDGRDDRRILDVDSLTSEPAVLDAASAAARSAGRIAVDGEQIPVFDLRAATPGAPPSADGGAPGGCLLIGRRGVVRVALLVD